MNKSFWSLSRIRVIVAAFLVMACDTGTVGFSGPNGRSGTGGPTGPDSTAGLVLTINPNPIRIAVGTTGQFTSRLQDALGNVITGTVTWGSNNTAVATVDASGLATGVGAGNTTITASQHGLTTSASIEVDPVPVASVAVTPRVDTLQVGTPVTLSAVTKDAVGNTLTGRQITWTSRSPSIATVDAAGSVTAVAVGVDSVLATSEGVTGAAVITVVNVPVVTVVVSPTPDTILQAGTVQLAATPEDGGGNPLVRAVTWSSGSAAIATVNSAGLVTGVGLGTTTITATSGGIPGTASVTVIQAPVATVTVSPKTPGVQIGKTVQLNATTRDAKGNTLTGRVVTWASGTPGNATVDGTGLVTGAAAGTSVITATSEGINGTATVTVTVAPPTLVRIITSPDTATINTGGTKQFSTVGKYSDSSTAAVTSTYTATGGTVTANGLYTAGANAGTFRVIATASGFADTSTVTVVKPPVALVIVTPALDTVAAGSSYQLAVVTKDAGGNVLTGRVVTWGSSNTAVATVSGSGKVTAVAAGTATITATSETIPGTATAVVQVVLAASIQITPASAELPVGSTTTLTATARDKLGNILSGHPTSWQSLNAGIAGVTQAGSVSGVAVGSTSVTVTVDTLTVAAGVKIDSVAAGPLPFLVEDWSTYSSTSNMMSDPRGIYAGSEDIPQGGGPDGAGWQMVLDPTTGYGVSSQSMRYDQIDRTSEGGSGTSGRCTDATLSRSIKINKSEVWAEVYIKFSANFTVIAPAAWGCTSATEYKLIFGGVDNTSRFNLEMQPSRWVFGYPTNEAATVINSPSPSSLWDGQWHQFRFHFKIGSGNGRATVWIDGVLVSDLQNANTGANSSVTWISLGKNLNQGPGQDQHVWWGRVALFSQDPGW